MTTQLELHYSNGSIDALEKIAAGMTMDQARTYVKSKQDERGQDAMYAAIGGLGGGIVEGLGDFIPGVSGRVAMIPGAILGYGASKLKNMYDRPSDMYSRDKKLTGRTYGSVLGGAGGATLGAGAGGLVGAFSDSVSPGLGMGIGGLLGGLLGASAGHDIGDMSTELDHGDKIRAARKEDAIRKQLAANQARQSLT